MYSRARVALTLCFPISRAGLPQGINLNPIHIGHARTLLIGSLIARYYGCPFHVRLDGQYTNEAEGPPLVLDRGDAILDAVGCLKAIGVDFDRMYWCPQDGRSLALLPDELGSLRAGWAVSEAHMGQILDDAIDNTPSLIIRGAEFASAASSMPLGGVAHLGQFVTCENAVFHALGQEKHELLLPLVYLGPGKMSKTDMRLVTWSILLSAPTDLIRRFLVATAMFPEDPLRHMETEFSVECLSKRHYAWNWQQWAEVVRMA